MGSTPAPRVLPHGMCDRPEPLVQDPRLREPILSSFLVTFDLKQCFRSQPQKSAREINYDFQGDHGAVTRRHSFVKGRGRHAPHSLRDPQNRFLKRAGVVTYVWFSTNLRISSASSWSHLSDPGGSCFNSQRLLRTIRLKL